MEGNPDLLFPGAIIESCAHFRVTRNADTERAAEQDRKATRLEKRGLRATPRRRGS